MKKSIFLSILTVLVIGFGLGNITNKINAKGSYSEEFLNAYNFAYKNSITTVENIDKAQMNSPLTRIAMAKMLSNYAINVLGKKPSNTIVPTFTDVSKKLDEDYGGAVTLAYQLGIMGLNMKNNEFRPYDTVTRAEFGTALSRILYGLEDGKPYYATHLQKLNQEGIIINNNPDIKEKRGYVMIMLMRSQDKDTYLTEEEVQKLIEKEEGLQENSLSSRGYTCYSEDCTYEFKYSIDGKRYIYHRNNKTSGKIEKTVLTDLGINNAEDVALNDAKVSKINAQITHGGGSYDGIDYYSITITTKDNIFHYEITLDGKIQSKKVLISENKALEIILKEAKLEQSQTDIEKLNDNICNFNYDFDKNGMHKCSFSYGGKQYTSYINAKDGTFIPIKKIAGHIEYGENVTEKENIIISEVYSYIDSNKAIELLRSKYNINEEGWFYINMEGEGKNAIYIYHVGSSEYYIDASNGVVMNSENEIITTIVKDSGVSKDNIETDMKNNENKSFLYYIDRKTEEIIGIYSFYSQGITYTYKVRIIDGKILDSKKESDIGKDKAIKLAKHAILEKYAPELQNEYTFFYNRSRAYIRFNTSAFDKVSVPSEPDYIISYTDKGEKYYYRAFLKYDGSILSIDKSTFEDMPFALIFYYIGADLNDDKLGSFCIGGGCSSSQNAVTYSTFD